MKGAKAVALKVFSKLSNNPLNGAEWLVMVVGFIGAATFVAMYFWGAFE